MTRITYCSCILIVLTRLTTTNYKGDHYLYQVVIRTGSHLALNRPSLDAMPFLTFAKTAWIVIMDTNTKFDSFPAIFFKSFYKNKCENIFGFYCRQRVLIQHRQMVQIICELNSEGENSVQLCTNPDLKSWVYSYLRICRKWVFSTT